MCLVAAVLPSPVMRKAGAAALVALTAVTGPALARHRVGSQWVAPTAPTRASPRVPSATTFDSSRSVPSAVTLDSPRVIPSAGKRVTVLATGDSMIQIVDGFLKRSLERRPGVRVPSDAQISTGISKSTLLDWPRHAARQARRYRPRTTVVFIGANDGFPMRTPGGAQVACCGRAWSVEYGRRVATMMGSYARGGRGRVFWLLLPQARRGFFRRAFPAVNRGIRRAAAGMRRDARIVRLNKVFTPGGRYRPSMRYHGRLLRVRQADGVHLSSAGASIAAAIVVRRMRADHALRRRRRR